MPKHIVKDGDCLSSIADKYGYSDWRTIYDHPENSDFKSKRPDPHVLNPGDVLFLPDKEIKKESLSTGQRHRFRVRRPPVLLRLILLDEQRKPWAKRSYRLVIEGETFEGKTDSEGLISHEIAPTAESGHLTVWLPKRKDERQQKPIPVDYVDQDDPGGKGGSGAAASSSQSGQGGTTGSTSQGDSDQESAYEWDLAIGHLDPAEKVSGIQARLHNLGYSPGPIDGVSGPLTRDSVRRFQEANKLKADGIAGPDTQDKLRQVHGC